jgi:hypothetical protein
MAKSDPNNATYFTLTKSVHFQVKIKCYELIKLLKYQNNALRWWIKELLIQQMKKLLIQQMKELLI